MTAIIRNSDLDNIINGLASLDGRPEIVRVVGNDGSDKNMVNAIPYKLSAKVRLLAAQWLTVLRLQSEEAKKAGDGLFRQFQVIPPVEEGKQAQPPRIPPEKLKEYAEQLDELRGSVREHNIPRIPLAHLNVEENRLPITVLSALAPLIDSSEPPKT